MLGVVLVVGVVVSLTVVRLFGMLVLRLIMRCLGLILRRRVIGIGFCCLSIGRILFSLGLCRTCTVGMSL